MTYRTLPNWLFPPLISLLFAAFCISTSHAESKSVVAEGMAAITREHQAAIQDKALDDALRNAVEQVIGTLVATDTMTGNYRLIHDKILVKSSNYVRSYQILTESQQNGFYKVKIQAEVTGSLQRDLRTMGLLRGLAKNPKVMIIIDEKVAGMFGTNAWESIGQAESTLIDVFTQKGFSIVDPQTFKANIPRNRALQILSGDRQAAATAGLRWGAQLVIVGKAMSKNAGGRVLDSSLQSLQAVVQARVIRTDDAMVISSRSSRSSFAHIDEMQGGTMAIDKASRKLATMLIDDIEQTWQAGVNGQSRQVTLSISGLVSYRHLMAVTRFMTNELQGVKNLHQRSFILGSAELMLDYTGQTSHIAQELATRKFTGFRLEPLSVTPNHLEIKAVPNK